MAKTIVNYLVRESIVNINGRDFLPYRAVALGLNISDHPLYHARRQKRFPAHFAVINHIPMVSVAYAIRLERFHSVPPMFLHIKEKEVHNG